MPTPARGDVCSGSKPEKLNASKCFPLCTLRTGHSSNAIGISVSCQTQTACTDFILMRAPMRAESQALVSDPRRAKLPRSG